MRAKAVVHLPSSSEKQQTALIQALTPEVNRQIGVRSKVTLKAEGQFLVLNVKADDTIALRASLNTYLRWINSTLNVLETVKGIS